MEHKPLLELQAVADVKIAEPAPPMTREQRLERWIEVLEASATRRLRSLYEIEYLSSQERNECRSHDFATHSRLRRPSAARRGAEER